MIYLIEVSVKSEKDNDLRPVYLFYKPQESPVELRRSIDNILSKIRERKETPIHDRILLAKELNVFFDRIKILMLGIPFEPQKLEGTGIQVLVFRLPKVIPDHEVHILAIADSEDSPIAVRKVIKGILKDNKNKIIRLMELSQTKESEESYNEILDIYSEIDFKTSEALRTKIRKIRWAEKAGFPAAILGTLFGLTVLFILTGLVLWLDSIYHYLTRDAAIILGLGIILATSFFTGYITGWAKWIRLSSALVSLIGGSIMMLTLFNSYITAAYYTLNLSTFTFGLVIAIILVSMILFIYFVSFIFGYYLVETKCLVPPKIRILSEEKAKISFIQKLKTRLKGLT
ncbi:MAG: hypothetical protein Q6363_005430 [Candidatus Njordarchaeota archaeon]